jgi:threonylcarbamoyladenosine tRNA methylthiotransferase MtaB
MAASSLALIDDCDIVMAHIFPYSVKRGTPAARMPQVAPTAIKARARRLREAGALRRAAWLQRMVGTTQRVLIEHGGRGHTENFAPVKLSDHFAPAENRQLDPRLRGDDVGTVVAVSISKADRDHLIGVPA